MSRAFEGPLWRHECAAAGASKLYLVRYESAFVFVEQHQPDNYTFAVRSIVRVPWEEASLLAEHLERRLGLVPGGAAVEERLAACFDAMVAGGRLSPDRRMFSSWSVVAGWARAAGVHAVLDRHSRYETLAATRDEGIEDPRHHLSLLLSATHPEDGRGIRFGEHHSHPGWYAINGTTYQATVSAPYSSLPALVAYFEALPGAEEALPGAEEALPGAEEALPGAEEALPGAEPGPDATDPEDLEDRLLHGVLGLLRTGEITLGLDPGVARDRVAAHFEAAAVPTTRESESGGWTSY